MGWRPSVRGKAMNPVDHPHGGGEGKHPIGLKYPKTKWGKHALGVKTRKRKKYSDPDLLITCLPQAGILMFLIIRMGAFGYPESGDRRTRVRYSDAKKTGHDRPANYTSKEALFTDKSLSYKASFPGLLLQEPTHHNSRIRRLHR